jgi:hypothetical protein
MPGPRHLVLMFLPTVIAVTYLIARKPIPDGRVLRLRGLWVVPVALIAHIVRFNLLPNDWAVDTSIGRVYGVVNLLCACAFLALNRTNLSSSWPAACCGLVVSAAGVALNAIPVALVGAMPVSRSAALLAGYSPSELATPPVGYVFADKVNVFAASLGDVAGIPHFLKVLSIGDLMLFTGFAVLIYLTLVTRGFAKRAKSFCRQIPSDLDQSKYHRT